MRLAIVTDCFEENTDSMSKHIARIWTSLKDHHITDYKVIIVNLESDTAGTGVAVEATRQLPHHIEIITVRGNTLALGYLKGIECAIELGADKIIEIDSGGAHRPEEIGRFLKALDKYDTAFSSRFSMGGSNKYPLQRKLISRLGNSATNFIFGTQFTDSTSGFNGYKATVCKEMLTMFPAETWVSATRGPYHLYQTEERIVFDLVARKSGFTFCEVPINYGVDKKGKKLELKYVFSAFKSLFLLRKAINK